jgi:hypothetical protein
MEQCITIAIPGPLLYAAGIAVGFLFGTWFGYAVRGDDNAGKLTFNSNIQG